jgi:hypothetical protein
MKEKPKDKRLLSRRALWTSSPKVMVDDDDGDDDLM